MDADAWHLDVDRMRHHRLYNFKTSETNKAVTNLFGKYSEAERGISNMKSNTLSQWINFNLYFV
jgi:hypothetical protein